MATPRKASTSRRKRRAPAAQRPKGLAGGVTAKRPMKPVALGLVAVTLIGGGYLIKRAVDKAVGGETDFLLPSSPSSSSRSTKKKAAPKYPVNTGTFPLKFGQKGELIRTLQNALLNKGGGAAAEIRNSGGADAIFGEGVARALAAVGEYSSRSVDQAAFNRLLTGKSAAQLPVTATPAGSPAALMQTQPLSLANVPDDLGRNMSLPDVVALRKQLVAAVERFDPQASAVAVAAMRNVAGYKAVNYNSMGIRWPRAGVDVRQTIATKLGQTFAGNPMIRTALLSIGLKLDAAGIWRADFK
jgi:peptidoglycan hydrolase-like protein with peptidoglycan-binding domain